MYPDFVDRQNSYTVHPFLKALSLKKVKKSIYLTLSLTSHMVMNKIFRTQILNWVTSFPEVTGVYVIATPHDEGYKQIQSEEFLFSYMEFLQQLRNAALASSCRVLQYRGTSLLDDRRVRHHFWQFRKYSNVLY